MNDKETLYRRSDIGKQMGMWDEEGQRKTKVDKEMEKIYQIYNLKNILLSLLLQEYAKRNFGM